MSLIVEIITTAIPTVCGTICCLELNKKIFKPKIDKFGAYPWLYNSKKEGFVCPKCTCRTSRQPSICDCEEYPNIHFHFKCGDSNYSSSCGFKTIMRTADDK